MPTPIIIESNKKEVNKKIGEQKKRERELQEQQQLEPSQQRLVNFYQRFMSKENSQAQHFTSVAEFKNSDAYKELPESEKDQLDEQLKQCEGKNVIILYFETAEQAREFMQSALDQGIFTQAQFDNATKQLEKQDQASTYAPGM